MSYRKYILNQHENSNWYTPSMVAPATLGANKRPAGDEEDNERFRLTKRRNVCPTTDYTQDLTSLYQSHNYSQVDRGRASTSWTLPHPPSRPHAALSIKVPERERHLVQQALNTSHGYGYRPPSNIIPTSGWRFYSPSYSYGAIPLAHPPEMTRSVLRASSSHHVQRHRESRQDSLANYYGYSLGGDLIPPRRYANSPSSPLFPPWQMEQDMTYSEDEDSDNFEPGTARSMSPEPFTRRDSESIPECLVSSSLANNTPFRGKLRALIIALEYRGAGQKWNNSSSTDMKLRGPYQDGEDIRRLLVEQGYNEGDITFMKDSPYVPSELQPTCKNIKYQLERLVADAVSGDRFFLYYAGHGIQVRDTNGDEADGKDEAIIPSDWATVYNYSDNGLIIDDYLKEVCVESLPQGAHLTAVFDCCHAGTIMDLTYEHSAKNSSGFELNRLTGLSTRRLANRFRSVDGRVLCISACEDDQRAYAGQRGLLTEAFTRCIRGLAKSYSIVGVTIRLNPTLKRLYEFILQHGRPNPQIHGSDCINCIQDPMLATTFRLSVAEYHRPLLI